MASSANSIPVFNEQGVRLRGGFSPGIFPDGFDVKFKCLHCHNILKDPYQGTCGHRFCRSCADEILRISSRVDCPACVEEPNDENEKGILAMDSMFPDNGVKREMSLIVTKCMSPQCQWQGYFKEYENHENNCPFKQVACALCAQPVLDGHIEEHRSTQCSKRMVNCEHCSSQVVFAALKKHYETCQKFPIKCDACGKTKIPRDSVKDHMEQLCPKRIVSCPMGCTDQFSLDKFSQHIHISVDIHLAWTVQKIAAMEQKILDMVNSVGVATPASLSQVKGSIGNLEKKIQSIERQLQQVVQKTSATLEQSSVPAASKEGGAASDQMVSSELAAKASLKYMEPVLGVMHGELKRAQLALQDLEVQNRQHQEHMDQMGDQYIHMQRELRLKETTIADLELRLSAQEMARKDSTILWKITDFSTKQMEAKSGVTTSLYSPAFYSGPCGYKMCARIYPNGDGVGKNSHISLFFVIKRGHYDALLPWPFSQKVTLMMIDQNHKEHIVDAFKPDTNSTSFKRPTTEMNIASGCPMFLPLDKLYNPNYGYLKDDTIFVKIIVDTEGLDRYTEMNPGKMGYQ